MPYEKILKISSNLHRIGTYAYRDFILSWLEIRNFLHYIFYMAVTLDKNYEVAHEALKSFHIGDKEKYDELVRGEKSRKSMVGLLKDNKNYILETSLTKIIDNFLNYLSSVLGEVYINNPLTLKSNEQIEVEMVLEHDTIQSLIKTISERKVARLSYKSFDYLFKFFNEKFGVNIIMDKFYDLMRINIEVRNIIVHNRAIIDRRFIERTGKYKDKINKRYNMGIEDVENVEYAAIVSVIEMDKQLRKNIKIKGHRFGDLNLSTKTEPS